MRVNPKLGFALLALLSGFILLAGPIWAYKGPPHSPPVTRTEPDPRFTQYVLPVGSAFQVLLQTPVNTATNQIQDPVEVIMDTNLYLGEELILTKNTRFKGYINQLEPPIQGRNAILHILFTEIYTDIGEILPINAHVRTERKDHKWGGELTPGTTPMISTQQVYEIGEYNRVVYGGPRAMGQQIMLSPGDHWTLILDQPLTLLKSKEEL
jgi:hypothetical protein